MGKKEFCIVWLVYFFNFLLFGINRFLGVIIGILGKYFLSMYLFVSLFIYLVGVGYLCYGICVEIRR